MRRELVATLFLSVALTACGGGGSSNGNGSGGGGNSVLPPAPLAITTSSLPQGVQGSSYTTVLKANGGTSPYKWTVAPSLPAGLSLDGDTGTISRDPRQRKFLQFHFPGLGFFVSAKIC